MSRSKKSYAAFMGIPYAKPPIGDLRFAVSLRVLGLFKSEVSCLHFKNPEPPENWTGLYNATYYRPRCIQRNYIFTQLPAVEGSEDCLYLNIYVPEVS